MLRPEICKVEVVLQASSVKVPQVPEYTTITIVLNGVTPVIVNLWLAFVATKLYHTSSSNALNAPHEGTGTPVEAVALMVLPAV